jgi:hypothetical protein
MLSSKKRKKPYGNYRTPSEFAGESGSLYCAFSLRRRTSTVRDFHPRDDPKVITLTFRNVHASTIDRTNNTDTDHSPRWLTYGCALMSSPAGQGAPASIQAWSSAMSELESGGYFSRRARGGISRSSTCRRPAQTSSARPSRLGDVALRRNDSVER